MVTKLMVTDGFKSDRLLALLKAMASTPIGYQKRKNQPRAIKRRPKPFPLLTIPRYNACQLINL